MTTLEERARNLFAHGTPNVFTERAAHIPSCIINGLYDIQALLEVAMRQVDENTRRLGPPNTPETANQVGQDSDHFLIRSDTYRTLKQKADAFDDKEWLKIQKGPEKEAWEALLEAAKGVSMMGDRSDEAWAFGLGALGAAIKRVEETTGGRE